MKQLLLVGIGGFIGSIARYKLSGIILHRSEGWNFPLGTFAVNLIGCLVIGLLAGLAEKHDFFSASTRIFLFTGLLGGFTTFSAFAYEDVFLFRRGLNSAATSYVVLSVIGGLAAVWVGMRLISIIWPAHH